MGLTTTESAEPLPATGDPRRRWIARAVTVGLVLMVGWDFAVGTEFFGDDQIFLAFARYARHPFEAFLADRHGGEYYRPIPMMLWWILGRAGHGSRWPFAVLGLGLHMANAVLTRAFARRCGASRAMADLAGMLFLVAPAGRDAALWFSASTDLLATAATLGALLCLVRDTRGSFVASLALAAAAYLSKESAIVLPLLAAAMLVLGSRAKWRGQVGRALAHAALALAYLTVRLVVLGGWGGSGDRGPAPGGRGLQLLSGLVHGLVGYEVLAAGIAWILGATALAWGIATLVHDRGAREARTWLPLIWIGLTLAPLLAAGWVVGSRYFYLPAVGLAILVARAVDRRGPAAAVVSVGFLLALGTLAAIERRERVTTYRNRVAAARDAVVAGVARGHRLFHVRCGIKDLDLVLKGEPALASEVNRILVLSDVPASFVMMPPSWAQRTRFLRASPPLPPAGAYRFGGVEIVGLARREESPDLKDVIDRLPELDFVALVANRDNSFSWREVKHTKN